MEIIINPIGGLANRMRAIAAGVSLSLETGSKCKIVWPVNTDLYCPFDLLFKKLPYNIEVRNIKGREDLLFYDIPRKRNMYISGLLQYGKYCKKIVDSHDDIKSEVTKCMKSDKPFLIRSGLEFYDYSPRLYRNLFHPQEYIVDKVNEIIDTAYSGKIIGIHIRRTDNAKSISESPLELFIETVNRELKNDPNVKFYLATDDEWTKEHLTTLYGDRIIYSTSNADRTSVEGIKDAMIEMLCLSKCEKIYGSYWSSFSEAAALYGNTQLIQLRK